MQDVPVITKATSTIIETSNILDIIPYFNVENTAFIYDIDNTVLEYKHTAGSDQWLDKHIMDLINENINQQNPESEELKKKITRDAVEEGVDLYEKIVNHAPANNSLFVDDNFIKVFEAAQNKNCTIFACTSRGTYVADKTMEQLDYLGVNYNQGILKDKKYKLSNSEYSALKNGILFTSGGDKGKSIESIPANILALSNIKRIVFIDDKLKNVERVRDMAERQNIEYIGVRYSKLDNKIDNVDLKAAKIQIDAMFKVLSDHHAKILAEIDSKVDVSKTNISGSLLPHLTIGADKLENGLSLLWGVTESDYNRIIKFDSTIASINRVSLFKEVNGNKISAFGLTLQREKVDAFLDSFKSLPSLPVLDNHSSGNVDTHLYENIGEAKPGYFPSQGKGKEQPLQKNTTSCRI